ncbi:HEAT repeat domain-containing protein [Clostridium sp. P21]|uniref:HEAT repeat domain-containing protein n=1 Tax=Clostridium muellerianum TaxID=2716538 RepID=A0A7Y0ECV3_9CLOT|nr:HEAT repeat domain-containing protein [Clostridium muellerianum]NMM61151.1 HEAT repeat domain-containing protein [Clostridium muellerianum]
MKKGMIDIEWSKIDSYTEEDITYFLFLEGKSVGCLCKIRNLSKEIVQKHILDGKIKYGILAKSGNEKELFQTISLSGKLDKIEVLKGLDEDNKSKLMNYIRCNYGNMKNKDKESAVWILGEIGDSKVLDILMKASVHNHVTVRRMAVSAIGKIGDKSAENILIRKLDDENPQVVMYAIKSLIKVKSKKAGDKVRKIYENTEKDYIRRVSEEYLKIIEKVELQAEE